MGSYDRLDGLDYRIILAFANNSMKTNVTAKQLNYTDGTIYYHLNKIKRLTGLDPWKFWDLVKLCDLVKGEHSDE